MREWFEVAVVEPWESLHIAVEEITEASNGRWVCVEGAISAQGRSSGAEADIRVWQVLWFRGGKIGRRQLYCARDEALEAVGLQE